MRNLKLYMDDSGDWSVGIMPEQWVVETPIYIEDDKSITDDEKEDLEWFRSQMLQSYKEYSQCRLTATYDFELEYKDEE